MLNTTLLALNVVLVALWVIPPPSRHLLFPAQNAFLLEPMGHLVQRRTAFSSVDRLSYVAARASLSEASSVVTHEFLFGSPIKNITNALFGTDARLVS